MKIAEYEPTTKSDVHDIPDWGEKVLSPLNKHLLQLTQALQKRLNFADNLNGEPRSIRMRHLVAVDIKLTGSTKGKPRRVTVSRCDPAYYSAIKWESPDSETVRVTVAFSADGTWQDTPPTGDVLVTLDIEGSS